MKTSITTIFTASIDLTPEEEFTARVPKSLRTIRVHWIEVGVGSFTFFGDTSWRKKFPSSGMGINWHYRKVIDVSMPHSVAVEVQRCLDELKQLDTANKRRLEGKI